MLALINRKRSRSVSASHPRQDHSSPGKARAQWGLLLGLTLGAASAAQAADLGALRVLSASGGSLRAEIDVTSLKPEEAASLKVALAGPGVYQEAHVQYRALVQALTLSLQDRPDGRKVVVISSDGVLDVPALDMLVELTWSSGRVVRQYSFTLNAPPATAEAPMVDNSGRAPLQVAAGETLFGLATQIQPPGTSVYQSMTALMRANPKAFIDGNMNLLRTGALLTVPTDQDIAAVNVADANRLVAEQTAGFSTYRDRMAAKAAASPRADSGVAGPEAQGSIAAKPSGGDEPQAKAGDELKLSTTGPESHSQQAARDRLHEERDANAKALAEAESRVNQLQHDVDSMRSLLSAQNQTLAGMEQGAQANTPDASTAAAGAPPAAAVETPAATPGASAAAPEAPAASDTPAATETPPAADAPAGSDAAATPAPASTEPTAAPEASAASVTPTNTLEWLRDHRPAVVGGIIALLALILGALALRRRPDPVVPDAPVHQEPAPLPPEEPMESLETTETLDGVVRDWGPIAAFPAADAATIARPVFNEEDFSDEDVEPVAEHGHPPLAPAAFGFDLDLVDKAPPVATERIEPVVQAQAERVEPAVEIEPAAIEAAPAEPVIPAVPVELAPVEPAPAERPAPAAFELDTDVDTPDVASKLVTAQAYLDLGDITGARELFREVLRDGDAEQRLRALKALDAL